MFFSHFFLDFCNIFVDYEHNIIYNKLTEKNVSFLNIALRASKKILVYYVKVS